MKRIRLLYDIGKKNEEGKLKLFDSDFFEIHHKKYLMVIKNKISTLKEEYLIQEKNFKNLKIILIPFIDCNMSLKYMFQDCPLMKFSLKPNNEKKN